MGNQKISGKSRRFEQIFFETRCAIPEFTMTAHHHRVDNKVEFEHSRFKRFQNFDLSKQFNPCKVMAFKQVNLGTS